MKDERILFFRCEASMRKTIRRFTDKSLKIDLTARNVDYISIFGIIWILISRVSHVAHDLPVYLVEFIQ